MEDSFDNKKLVIYWIEGSEKDYKAMLDLFKTKNYSWSLFMGHLVIEKLLKALYSKEKKELPPLIHDLRRIAEKADIVLSDEKKGLWTLSHGSISMLDMMTTNRAFIYFALKNLLRNG